MTALGKDWCILRCSGVSTLRLADSLVSSGIEAWTPREEIRKLVRGKCEWVATPMFPSFVFAQAGKLSELLELTRSPSPSYMAWDSELRRMVMRGHPFFRLFHIGDDYRSIPDSELDPVRRIEGRRNRKPRGKPKTYVAGDKVRLTVGAYEGLRGVVAGVKGKMVDVQFPGSKLEFQFYAHVLIPDVDERREVCLQQSQLMRAA